LCLTSLFACDLFLRPLSDLIIFLTITRLVVVINFVNFSFALFTPPSRRLSVALVEMRMILLALFANLNMQQKEKLNELIGAIHEKDELLDSQEEFLIKENKKHVKVKMLMLRK
jgi:hypothetical protein